MVELSLSKLNETVEGKADSIHTHNLTDILGLSNSATIIASNENTKNQIVLRDSEGNFSAGIITASLNGNSTTSTTTFNIPTKDVGGNLWIE